MSGSLEVAFFILLAIGGLVAGSFVNVLIVRVPEGRSIMRPRSSCVVCGTAISPRDNVPVVSWVLLRGRCRTCGDRISAMYPIVEAVTAVVWIIAGRWAVRDGTVDALLPVVLIVATAGVALFVIDLQHLRLPNPIVFALYPLTAIGLVFAGVASGSWPVIPALVSALIWLVLIGGVWLVTGGRGMGFGDVKLAPVLGVTLGWIGIGPAVVGLFAAWLLGGLWSIGLLVSGRARRGSSVPFGPFLLLGWMVGLLFGSRLAEAYLGVLG